ncbi:MAG: CPBP family intramembrane glutamic endopeptidase [Acidobacteriota bacterium]
MSTAARRRALRLTELVVVFLAVPLALYAVRHDFGQIIIPTLLVVGGTCLVLLLLDPSFDRRRLWMPARRDASWRADLGRIVRLFVPSALAVALLVAFVAPELLFELPRRRPVLWLVILVAYPLVSVYPQELIFRTFFFHRYRDLFPDHAWLIAASGLSFGLAHVFFGNWLAPLLTLVGGLLFARTYARTRSTALACFEHALWGDFLFTIGLGHFFYGGAIGS